MVEKPTSPLPSSIHARFYPTSAITRRRRGGEGVVGRRDTVKRIENWKIVSFLINESRRGRGEGEERERERKATDEGTRGGAAIVQVVIAPRPAVPTIQCPPLLHCRVLSLTVLSPDIAIKLNVFKNYARSWLNRESLVHDRVIICKKFNFIHRYIQSFDREFLDIRFDL